jgi:hypothetical protein
VREGKREGVIDVLRPDAVREGEREGESASSTSSSSMTRASELPSDREDALDDSAKVKERYRGEGGRGG